MELGRTENMELLEICRRAKAIATKIGLLDTNTNNQALHTVADFLVQEQKVQPGLSAELMNMAKLLK